MRPPREWSALGRMSSSIGSNGTGSSRDGGKDRKWSFAVCARIVVVAICGGLLWAGRVVRDRYDPVYRSARQLRTGTVVERRKAVELLGRFGDGYHTVAIPALTAALGDEDAYVATTAAWNLRAPIRGALRQGDTAAARTAIAALAATQRDPRPRVRQGAAWGLAARRA